MNRSRRRHGCATRCSTRFSPSASATGIPVTIRAALNEIFDYGRPASILLAALVGLGRLPHRAGAVAARRTLLLSEQEDIEDAPVEDLHAEHGHTDDGHADDGPVELTAASWGGGYGESQELSLFEPFRIDSTHELSVVAHDGDADSIASALAAEPAPWEGRAPTVPQGWTITAIATESKIPRQTLVLPNGDILVAEGKGKSAPVLTQKDYIAGLLKSRGATSVEGGNRLTLLRDADGDGTAEEAHVFLDGQNQPFGMALVMMMWNNDRFG